MTATAAADTSKSATATITLNPVLDVGTGAPTATLQNQFVNSFFRNGFNNLVSLPPLGNVKTLGTGGYVQEFNDAAKSGAKLALATASPSAPSSQDGTIAVVQLLADLYAYYTTVGAGDRGIAALRHAILSPDRSDQFLHVRLLRQELCAVRLPRAACLRDRTSPYATSPAAPASCSTPHGRRAAASPAWDVPWMWRPPSRRPSFPRPLPAPPPPTSRT